jgi:hypothetical protein
MTNSDGAYDFIFATGELEDELQLFLILGPKDGRGCASERATPVTEDGVGNDGERL